MRRFCNARRKQGGGRCRKPPVRDRLRCVLHGGAAGSGHHFTEDARHSTSLGKARAAVRNRHPIDHAAGGRARAWRAVRAPNGRFLPAAGVRRDRLVARALSAIRRRIEETSMAKKKTTVPAVPAEAAALPAKPWGEMTKAQRLAHNTDLALGAVKTILELEVDPANLKLLGHIKDTALGVISQQIKVDERQLSAAAEPAKRDPLLERLSAGLRERLKR